MKLSESDWMYICNGLTLELMRINVATTAKQPSQLRNDCNAVNFTNIEQNSGVVVAKNSPQYTLSA